MSKFRPAIQTALSVTLIISGLVLLCSTADSAVSESSDTFQQGRAYFDSGNFHDAYDLFLEAFKADPGKMDLSF
jgi:hypothetical protein